MNPVLHINGCALFPLRYHIIPKVYTVLSTAYLETSVGAVHLLVVQAITEAIPTLQIRNTCDGVLDMKKRR